MHGEVDYTSHTGVKYEEIAPILPDLMEHGFNVLAYGPPGTGKTSLGHAIRREMEKRADRALEPLTYQCHEESTQGELMVSYLPSPDGGVLVLDGVGVRGWTNGQIVVFDEINHLASSPAISTFYRLMDDPSIANFRMPNGDIVKPAKGFSVWATMNGDPTTDLPPAILDRFHLQICMWMPTDEMIASLPPGLRKLPPVAYRDPNNAWPTFRDTKNYGRCCEVLKVAPEDTSDENARRVAKAIWGGKWAEALHAIDAANRERDPDEEF